MLIGSYEAVGCSPFLQSYITKQDMCDRQRYVHVDKDIEGH